MRFNDLPDGTLHFAFGSSVSVLERSPGRSSAEKGILTPLKWCMMACVRSVFHVLGTSFCGQRNKGGLRSVPVEERHYSHLNEKVPDHTYQASPGIPACRLVFVYGRTQRFTTGCQRSRQAKQDNTSRGATTPEAWRPPTLADNLHQKSDPTPPDHRVNSAVSSIVSCNRRTGMSGSCRNARGVYLVIQQKDCLQSVLNARKSVYWY